MFNDSIRLRLSCDSDDEFARFMLFVEQSGLKIEPFAYRKFQGQKPVLRMQVEVPDVVIPPGLDLQNPPRLD